MYFDWKYIRILSCIISYMKKKRLIYLIAAIVLFVIELLIALFVHDSFVRPYVGDMLVVILIYCFVRIFIPEKFRLLPLAVFLFALATEIMQYFKIVSLLHLEDNAVLSTIIGTSFDLKDVLCYAFGCILLGIYEMISSSKSPSSHIS